MQVKSIAECSTGLEHSVIRLAGTKLPLVFKTCVMSISEWSLRTGIYLLYIAFVFKT